VGAAGVFSGGFLGTPGIGYVQDYYAAQKLSREAPALYETVASTTQNSFLFFPKTTGLDGAKVGPVLTKPPESLNPSERQIREAVIHGARMSLTWTALVPLTMAVGYLGLIVYFRSRGGYRQVEIGG